ncbi:MAG: hypothetical protein F6K26_48635 [Moorea sp. SIO2I5]|nr:hypothetical protein [Moorena sp. SIO2I5]
MLERTYLSISSDSGVIVSYRQTGICDILKVGGKNQKKTPERTNNPSYHPKVRAKNQSHQ